MGLFLNNLFVSLRINSFLLKCFDKKNVIVEKIIYFFTFTPLPSIAMHDCICQSRSLILCKPSPSAISAAVTACPRSCLFAYTSNGTPRSFSSSKSSDNSCPVSSSLLMSALSTT